MDDCCVNCIYFIDRGINLNVDYCEKCMENIKYNVYVYTCKDFIRKKGE